MRRALVVLAVVLVLAGCGSGGDTATTTTAEPYSDEARANFIETCAAAGSDLPTCTCLIDELEATVPFDRFREIDAFLRGNPGGELPAEVVAAMEACGVG